MGGRHSNSNKDDDASCCHKQKHRPPVQTEVSVRLAQSLAQTEGRDTNMVFCPLLIQLVLSMIAAGSQGSTRLEILRFLRSESIVEHNQLCSDLTTRTFKDGSDVGGPRLSFVNGVWVDKSICLKQAFKLVLDTVYKAASKQVDFHTKVAEVSQEVNSWVNNNTNGLIKELIPPGSLDASTRLVFTNALYFKGTWIWKFDPSRTIDSNFNLLGGGSVKVPFMTSKADQYISIFRNFKVLRLCYEKGRDNRQFSMHIFLPNARDGLPNLLQKVASQPNFLERHNPLVQVGVSILMLPRFKVSFGLEATKTLKHVGLTLPFTNPDFSEMLESKVAGKNLRVSRVFHKSFIEVNEEGTEAAAATAAVVMMRSINLPDSKVDFVADHPFLFFIREDISGDVLFFGHVMNPQNSRN